MTTKLNSNFMAELFKLIYCDSVMTRIATTNLTYSLIPKEWAGYKFLLKEAVEIYTSTEKVPSLGVASQKYMDNDFVQDAIKSIQNANKVDREIIIDQLESYIKDVEFQLLSAKVHDLYEEGKKEEAIKTNAEESQRILSISLRHEGGTFHKVFRGFKERQCQRNEIQDENSEQITLGLDKLDELSYGGGTRGDTVLWIARSGVGKTTALRHAGVRAALNGYSVFHVQLEGTVQSCLDKYDQYWTNISYGHIKTNNLTDEEKVKVEKTLKQILDYADDIDVYGFEKFGEATMVELRNLIINYYKSNGHYPDVLVLDSLDLVGSGINKIIDDNPSYKKDKLQKCAQLFKNICIEFKMLGVTATQASNVPIDIWDNCEKVIDRSYTEGDKTLVKPFSFVLTCNQTIEESKNNEMRIYIDKMRDYKGTQQVFKIVTDYEKARFCNMKATRDLFGNESSIRKSREETEKSKGKLVNRKLKQTRGELI